MKSESVPASTPDHSETNQVLKLALTLLLLAAGFITAGILYYRKQADEFRQAKEQQITSVVDLKVHDLVRWRAERMGDARFYQGNATFGALVRHCLAHPDDADKLTELRSWLSSTRKSHGYEVLLLDATGRHQLPLFPTVGLSAAESAAAAQAQETGRITFVDFHRNEASGQIVLSLLIPLRHPADIGQPTGLLVWRIDPSVGIYPLLRSWPTPSPSAEIILLRREGNDAVFLNELRFQSGTALTLRLPLNRTEIPAVQAALGREGILEGTDYRGVPVLTAAHQIPDSPWTLLARIDQSEVFAPMKADLITMLIVVSALLFGTGASVGLIWHQRSARFLQEKLVAATAAREGEERLRLVVSATNLGLYDINLQTGAYVVSPEYARMLGHDPATFQETDAAWRERMHPADRPRVLRAIKEYLASRDDEYRFEFRQRTKTGEWKWVLSLGKLFSRTPDGQPLRLLGMHLDITERKQAEEALHQSREEFRDLFEYAPVGYHEVNAEGRIARMNQTELHLLGYAAEELVGQYVWKLSADEALSRRAVLAKLGGEAPPPPYERLFRRKDGSTFPVLVEDRLLRKADGTITGIRTVVRDITASKLALVALRESEEKLRQIVELSDQVFYSHTPDHVLTYVSPQAKQFFDCEPAEVRERWTGFLTDHPINAAGLALTETAIATGRPQPPYQLELQSKKGRRLWVEVRETPVVVDGKTVAIIGALTDITSTRQTRELMGLQSAALEATSNSVVITDAAGNVEWVNPAFCRVTGYTAQEIIGRNPRLLKSGQQPATVYADMWHTIKAGNSWSGEFVNVRKDGGLFTEEVTVTPVPDQSGTIAHFVAVKQDITERKSLEKQLFQTQRLEGIGLLASGIAHDLNNVLAPIALSIEMLRLEFPAPGTKNKLDMIDQACRRGADIIRQVLTFARGVDGERTALPVDRLVKEMVRLIGETFPRNIEVSYELTPDNYLACGDATQIHQVLLNLAVNARDAMPGGGSLVFTLSHRTLTEAQARTILGAKSGKYVVVTASDTGSGIPPEVLPHIFEPFYTTKPRGKGTGLGLSTVYGIVRSHGGFIEVASLPTVGTKFMVHLPAVDRKTAVTESMDSMPPLKSGRGECILVAEDETMIRDVITTILISNGFTVITAVDGLAALEEFHANRAHLRAVVLDLMMPKLNGDAVARQIHDLAPDMPIIISSGLIGEGELQETAEAMKSLGISQILHKPYSEGALLKALRRCLHA